MRNLNWIMAICILESLIKLISGSLQEDTEPVEQSQAVAHSRKRRYVVFPEGSTLTVATSLQVRFIPNSFFIVSGGIMICGLSKIQSWALKKKTVAACISPTALSGTGAIFTSGVAWALSYDLPNETIHTKDNKFEFPITIRRHKRDLFVRMEKLMDSAGMDGKNCVLKTICETVQHLLPRQGILEEILRLLFTYPPEEKSKHNWLVNRAYVEAHQAGESDGNCNDLFPCPISLLELGLGFGKYPQTYL